MDGPRAVRPTEMDALRHLTDIVFRPKMPEQYPQLFNDANQPNLRVCFDGDICTSHVGMVQRNALINGCRIRVCCIGSVATHPDYRNQGLASACFDDTVSKSHADGVDVMIVSGGRGLYVRNGCLHLGLDYKYKVGLDQFPDGPDSELLITELSHGDLDLIAECYRKEPVRFVRPPDDYRYVIDSGWAMNSPSTFLVLRQNASENMPQRFLGYVVLRNAQPGSSTSLTEFGGDRHAVLRALPGIVSKYALESLSFQVMGSDHVMHTLCETAGLVAAPSSASGTIKLINFQQLMTRMHPLFEEIIGSNLASFLRFSDDGENYTFGHGDDEIVLDRDTATRTVFGTQDGLPDIIQDLDLNSQLGLVLNSIFPLPTLWYGINYV